MRGNITSSTRDGKIFRVLKPSENLSKTPVRPFMNDIFSSLVFDVKLERSRKLRVEIGSDEKNGCDGSVEGVGLLFAWRVIRDRKRPNQTFSKGGEVGGVATLQRMIKSLYACYRFPSTLPQTCQTTMSFVGSFACAVHGIDDTTERMHIRGRE